MKYKAVIFDLDGTLIDTAYDIGFYINLVLRKYSFPEVEEKNISSIVGWGLKDAMFKALPEDRREPDLVENCTAELINEYEKNPVIKTYIYEGIPEMLDKLKSAGLKMAVFSNKAHPVTVKIVEILFGNKYFQEVRGAVENVAKKPDPEGVYLIAEKINADLKDILYIGDSDVDMITAKNAGLEAVSVLWGYRTKKQLEEAGASIFISRPEDLMKYL